MGGGIKIILFGNSYGGYLANLCSKISPWNIDYVLDNSSFINFFGDIFRLIGFGKEIDFTKFHGTFDNKLFKNIFLYLSDKTFWTSNKDSSNYFSQARKLIREPLNEEHLKIQSSYINPKYILYHSKIDERAPFEYKNLYVKFLKDFGFDVDFYAIENIDDKYIKNLNHGLGLSTKLFFKKHLPQILDQNIKNKDCKKEISYKSDDLIYTFKEEDNKIKLDITKA